MRHQTSVLPHGSTKTVTVANLSSASESFSRPVVSTLETRRVLQEGVTMASPSSFLLYLARVLDNYNESELA